MREIVQINVRIAVIYTGAELWGAYFAPNFWVYIDLIFDKNVEIINTTLFNHWNNNKSNTFR